MNSKTFDIGEAIFFFFRRVASNPVSALWLSTCHFLLSIIVAGMTYSLFAPVFGQIMEWAVADIEPTPGQVFQTLGSFLFIIPVLIVVGISSVVMTRSAWLRFLARGEVASGIPFRIGDDEFRLLGLALMFFIVGMAIEMVMAIVMGIIGISSFGILALAEGHWAATASMGLVSGLSLLALTAVFIVVIVRLSPAFGLTFLDQKFRFLEAWDATSGRFWPMIVSYVSVGLIASLITGFVVFVSIFPMAGSLMPLVSELEALGDMNKAMPNEVLTAVKDIVLIPSVLAPLGFVVIIAFLAQIMSSGMMMGVGVYTAKLFREDHKMDSTDAPVLGQDHPAGPSPSEG